MKTKTKYVISAVCIVGAILLIGLSMPYIIAEWNSKDISQIELFDGKAEMVDGKTMKSDEVIKEK